MNLYYKKKKKQQGVIWKSTRIFRMALGGSTGGTGGVGTETGVVSLTETGVGGTGGVGTESVTVNQEWGSGSWNDGAWGE